MQVSLYTVAAHTLSMISLNSTFFKKKKSYLNLKTQDIGDTCLIKHTTGQPPLSKGSVPNTVQCHKTKNYIIGSEDSIQVLLNTS